MAFNFLGTIQSSDDFAELEEFINVERNLINQKISHLICEQGRFFQLYKNFKKADAFLRREYSLSQAPDADWYVNPRQRENPPALLIDSLNAVDVDLLKKSFLDPIKAKREKLEFKIKRCLDLIEQYQNQINLLQQRQTEFDDIIARINSRFDNNEFPEVQKIAPEEETDKKLFSDPGYVDKNNVRYYKVIQITSAFKGIVFMTDVPPIKSGQIITLSGGLNNGDKTVDEIISHQMFTVKEDVKDEIPSSSQAVIKS